MGKTRRDILKISGAALATGLAGCQTQDRDRNTPSNTPNESTETPENNTETETPEPDIPDSYRADRKRISSTGSEPESVGDYSTQHEWDNLVTNTEEIQQSHQERADQEVYSPLVDRVMEGDDFEAGGRAFPNSDYEENDPGFFDQDAVRNEDNFERLIRWYLPAIMYHDRENYGSAPSSRNHRFAVTLETLINEHHPDEETEATSVTALPAHGIFGIQDENDEEFYMVDTTSSPQYDGAVGRIGDFNTSGFDPSQELSRQNLWDPFHEFEPGPIDFLPYTSKSRSSMGALMEFSATNEMGDNFDQFFITDEWMDEAYEVLRNGGSIQPITEPIEELLYNAPQLQEENEIGIYGTLDDTRIAVDSGDEVYEKVMRNSEPQGIDDIESMLEVA
jgi:hypothetical protein